MLKLIIEDDEGRKTVVPFVREEITIGRQEGNTIRLTERNVSRRHARLMRQNGHVVVEDLGSSNGTRINGERISGQSTVKDGDLIQIGDYDLALQSDAGANAITSRIRQEATAEEEPTDGEAAAAEPETELETPVQEEEASPPALGGPGDQRRHSTAIIKMDQVEGRPRKVEELEAEEAPRLVVVSAELKGQEYACIRTEMKIGRTDDNDIVIDHRSLSRTHAKIVREENGEWRIIDMQSANGLTVNGESYAQAPLNTGDVVELGHVKLKFVAAGEAVGSLSAGGRGKLPLIAAAIAVLLLGGGAAAFFLKIGPFSPGPDQPVKPPEVTNQDPTPSQPEPPETPDNPTAVPGDAAKKLAERIQRAQKEFDEGDLDKAEDDLKPAQNSDGTWPPEAQQLAIQLAFERKASKAIADAQGALDQHKFDDAIKLLAPAKGSKLFGPQHDALLAQIEEARKQPKPDPGKPPPPNNTTKPPVPAVNAQEEAKAAYEDAARLLRARQYDNALARASRCVELTPNNADCHMLLGASFAGKGNWEQAAQHYSKFLELAPDHKLAPKVRQTLENYNKSKSP